MKLAIHGAAGRMGQAVTRLAMAEGLPIVGAVDHVDSPAIGRDVGEVAGEGAVGVAICADTSSALLGADVLIDFSSVGAFASMLRAAMHAGVAVVSGTTGLDDDSLRLIDRGAERVAVLWAPNMSIGVQVLTRLVCEAARALGADYDVEIVEAHHGAKADAPSGTAGQLVAALQSVRNELRPSHGRQGQLGPRRPAELGVHAVRGGGVIGDHTVHLLGKRERLELTHRAVSRDLFAAGALRAARFIAQRPPGRYTLADVIDGAE